MLSLGSIGESEVVSDSIALILWATYRLYYVRMEMYVSTLYTFGLLLLLFRNFHNISF